MRAGTKDYFCGLCPWTGGLYASLSMNNFMCRATGITLLCLASTLSAQTQGSTAEPPLRGTALVKAVIALARDGEALYAEVDKFQQVDAVPTNEIESRCTADKRDEWLAKMRKGIAELRGKLEECNQAVSKIKPRQGELTARLEAFRKLVKEHPEAADNPIARIDLLLEAAESNIQQPTKLIQSVADGLRASVATLEGADYGKAKKCQL